MNEIEKEQITIFGEKSIAYVKKIGIFDYGVVREIDNVILATGMKFRKYIGDIICTMYTGTEYGTGDFILVSDRHGVIHQF